MNVLDIFYKNIVPEAMTGRIDCLNYYNIVFSTKIVDKNIEYNSVIDNSGLFIPTLLIKDKDKFDCLLNEYVRLAMNFYDDSNFDNDILNYQIYDDEKRICKEKVILALLFSNASVEDFNNPCDFIRKRINFICNDIACSYNLGYFDMFKGEVILDIEKDIINNETPYQMIIKVISENGDEFMFPRIKLAISDGVVYIYAIQNKQNDSNVFCKKINRILYRIGEGYSLEYDEDMEDLKDVTASFLVALNMCISYLYNNGYTKIVVPSILIERWNAKYISNLKKIQVKKLDKHHAMDMFDSMDCLQRNLTNKLIRTFLRLGCHYNNMDVLSFPSELDSCLHISIYDNDIQCNNSLLNETYCLVKNGIDGNFRRK